MQKLRTWSKSNAGIIVYVNIILTFIMPWLFKLIGASVAMRVGLLFFVIDGLWSLWIGHLMRKAHLPWWYSLLLPLLFGIMVFLRFAKYNYWFLPIYWLLTMLSWIKK
ncbi:hypothetical protein ACFQ5J_10200 [Lacticaseibacillus baoqingensis]|uniref:Uncharacterized protein n=1 Tax=Lacticaseibacillus baoqingensis TaxID=2486013 RepID=A0ABW4E6U0_9LACO|nr:hypothetical protein [Lacticaseibacillus baoqingensis]